MGIIQRDALIAKFQSALDNKAGYIYGKTWELWTKEKQEAYVKQYINDPDRKNSCLHGDKWIGHYVTDCSGLFAWAFKQLGGAIAHGSNSIWNYYCSAKGILSKGIRADGKTLLPGTAVFTTTGDKHNHIGLYVGNNTVIEAMGALNGVTTTKITNTKWKAWGELKNVNYTVTSSGSGTSSGTTSGTSSSSAGKASGASGTSSGGGGSKPMAEGTYVVTGNRVALRLGPSVKTNDIMRIATGETVQKAAEPEDWVRVTYKGKTGYMMKEYLKEG